MPPKIQTKVRSQVRSTWDAEKVHPLWWEMGTYAMANGDRDTVRQYRDELNVGDGPRERSEEAAAKIIAKYHKAVEDRDYKFNPDRRKNPPFDVVYYSYLECLVVDFFFFVEIFHLRPRSRYRPERRWWRGQQ
jgi:hypothetical protein